MQKTQFTKSYDAMEGLSETAPACPISGEKLPERAVRIVAWIVITLLISYGVTLSVWIPLFLTLDFSMRGIFSRKWAPLALVGRTVSKLISKNPSKKVDAAPKIFAARLGIAFSVILLLFHLTGLAGSVAMWVVGGMFITAAFLEAAFAFCLGCKIYAIIQRFRKPRPYGNGEGI